MTKSRGAVLSICYKALDPERSRDVPSPGTPGALQDRRNSQVLRFFPFYRGQFNVARNKDLIFVLKDFFPGKL